MPGNYPSKLLLFASVSNTLILWTYAHTILWRNNYSTITDEPSESPESEANHPLSVLLVIPGFEHGRAHPPISHPAFIGHKRATSTAFSWPLISKCLCQVKWRAFGDCIYNIFQMCVSVRTGWKTVQYFHRFFQYLHGWNMLVLTPVICTKRADINFGLKWAAPFMTSISEMFMVSLNCKA